MRHWAGRDFLKDGDEDLILMMENVMMPGPDVAASLRHFSMAPPTDGNLSSTVTVPENGWRLSQFIS